MAEETLWRRALRRFRPASLRKTRPERPPPIPPGTNCAFRARAEGGWVLCVAPARTRGEDGRVLCPFHAFVLTRWRSDDPRSQRW